MQGSLKNSHKISTQALVKIAILSAIGYVLMFISIPLPTLFPAFLKIDISDVTALIAGISMGPLAGVGVAFLKNLLQFLTGMSSTAGIGELANFLIGSAFVWTVAVIYKKNKNTKTLIFSLLAGVIAMVIAGCLTNYFIILPFYEYVGWSTEQVVEMGKIINPLIVDKLTFIIWMIAPFNLLKSVLMSLLILPMYKKLENILK